MTMLRQALLAAALATAPVLVLSATVAAQIQGPTIEQAWARPTTSMAKAGGAFLTIRNPGAEADRLVSADSPVAERVELHTHMMEGGIARMREVEGGIEIPAGGMVSMQPGGLHLMLMGLTGRLEPGGGFPLTLRFETAGEITVEVRVLDAGEQPPAAAGGHGMHGRHDHEANHGGSHGH